MKTICLYFEIHQIIHLKRYRFFDIGIDHYYYDDYENERSITEIAERSYMPALNTIGDMIRENNGLFRLRSLYQAWAWNSLRCTPRKSSPSCRNSTIQVAWNSSPSLTATDSLLSPTRRLSLPTLRSRHRR